jgi:hypothetical protein
MHVANMHPLYSMKMTLEMLKRVKAMKVLTEWWFNNIWVRVSEFVRYTKGKIPQLGALHGTKMREHELSENLKSDDRWATWRHAKPSV